MIDTALLKRYFNILVISSGLSLLQGGAHAETPIASPTTQATAAAIAAKYGNEVVYTVSRNGKKIGTHKMSFSQNGSELLVSVDSLIRVTVLRIPIYRLTYKSEERWLDNVLISANATTTEDGEANTVSYEKSNDENAAASPSFTSNHWHKGVLASHSLFNTLTGEVSQYTITDLGNDKVKLKGTTLSATHYRYSEDIETDVWYDENGLWVQMQFIGERGGIIKYLRVSD